MRCRDSACLESHTGCRPSLCLRSQPWPNPPLTGQLSTYYVWRSVLNSSDMEMSQGDVTHSTWNLEERKLNHIISQRWKLFEMDQLVGTALCWLPSPPYRKPTIEGCNPAETFSHT